MKNSKLIHFWAKTTHDTENLPNAYHPLICHLIDVAVSAEALWNEVLPQAAKPRLAAAFGLENEPKRAGKLIAFLVGLHDLGKCSPPFALRGYNDGKKQTARLLELYRNTDYYCASVAPANDFPHGFVTTVELPQTLAEKFNFPPLLAKNIAEIIGGHHGVFPTTTKLQNITKADKRAVGDSAWKTARGEIVAALAELFSVTGDFSSLPNKGLDNATAMIFAGFVTVADWIGSNTEFFPCRVEDSTKLADENINLPDYFPYAEQQAAEALERLGWANWAVSAGEKTFSQLFPVIKEPRHLQSVAVEIAQELDKPGIVVVEAPMGEGKTEAAMFLADTWNAKLKQRGIYFALPTQATSNQMFGRVKEFLGKRFTSGDVQLILQHGHSSINAEFAEGLEQFRQLHGIADDESKDAEEKSNVVAAEWFTYKKRGLLAPFGVGTVDQALLAVLQTKHVFVRLFGLAHKTVIIDEVHAYDAYMSTLLERLLEWLAALGSPVVLLSATLPKNRRDALVKAYQKGLGITESTTEGEDVYPRISYATDEKIKVRKLKTSPQNSKTLFLEKTDDNFVKKLKEKLTQGGCAAIICNTVKRAQDIYTILANDPFFQGNSSDSKPKLDLLHSRFRFKDRHERENRSLDRFGKPDQNGENRSRPDCAVLVSTQIIEQSLDLDFDLMISDLAPVDLLLQRAGRLHRHQRKSRPNKLQTPTLWIIQPPIKENNLPNFGANRFVYDEHILLRSWLKFNEIKQIQISNDIESLIEAVYGKTNKCSEINLLDFWNETQNEQKKKLAEKQIKAKSIRIAEFNDDDFFDSFNLQLDEDDPEKHQTLRAMTRDEDNPSVSVIMLTSEEAQTVNLNVKPDRQVAEFLMMREVKLSKAGLTQAILANPEFIKSQWKQSALLRHHRLLILNESQEKRIGNFKLILHDQKGVLDSQGGKDE